MQATNRYSGGDVYRLSLWPDDDGQDGEDPVQMRALYTTRDACYMLNVDVKTLRRWARELGIEPPGDTADKRVSGWTRQQLTTLARRHHRVLGEPPAEREPSRVVREIIARVQALEDWRRQVEREALLQTAGARQEGQETAPSSEGEQLDQVRQNVILARHRDTPPLPAGWEPFSTWLTLHGVAQKRSAWRWVGEGRLPAPERGEWVNPRTGQAVNAAYTPEQIPAALAALERLTGRGAP